MRYNQYIFAPCLCMTMAILAGSCGSHRNAETVATPDSQTSVPAPFAVGQPRPIGGTPSAQTMPIAVAYKTSAECRNLVPVNMADGKLVSFPAPSDLTAESTPLPLAGGYWLDRRGGVGTTTRFTNWTYNQYRAMPSTPSIGRILNNLNDIRVVKVVEIKGMTAQEAASDTAAVNRYLESIIVAESAAD